MMRESLFENFQLNFRIRRYPLQYPFSIGSYDLDFTVVCIIATLATIKQKIYGDGAIKKYGFLFLKHHTKTFCPKKHYFPVSTFILSSQLLRYGSPLHIFYLPKIRPFNLRQNSKHLLKFNFCNIFRM